MRIAHLILVHRNPLQLKRLITALDHPSADFYIHVDKKKDISPFQSLLKLPSLYFLEKRAKIYWGGYGTIEATLNGFEMIIPKGYDYINVISGQDFPVKSADYMYDYFTRHMGTEFITCDSPEGDWADAASRITDYHLINWRIPGKHRLEKILTSLLPRRVFPLKYKIVGRANWFTLTNAAASYAVDFLKLHPEVVRYFKYCWGADEFIFSTLLYNSSFRSSIQNNLVYVDWRSEHTGHPKLLVAEDFEDLKRTDKLFARKFDMDVDDTIFTLLENHIAK